MTENPYRPTNSEVASPKPRRSVAMYVGMFLVLGMTCVSFLERGFTLLNQDRQWIPTRITTYEIEIGGFEVSNQTVIFWSLGVGLLLLLFSLSALAFAIVNWRYNRRLTSTIG